MTYAISNIIEPSVFQDYVLQNTTIKSNFFNSGIVQFNEFADLAEGGGRTVDMPFWNDWGDGDANIDEVTGSDATPDTATSGDDIAFKHSRNIALTGPDLSAIVAGSDPLRVLADRAINKWDREYQKHLISSVLGVLADNDANDSDDMIYSVATDASGAASAAEKMSADVLIEGAQTMGDSKADLVAIGIHSRVHANLQKLGAVEDHYDLQTGALLFQTVMGKRVIVDDRMPVVAGSNRTTYISVLFGENAFGHGEGSPKVPLEYERSAVAYAGGGKETLVNRRKYILHPRGFAWQGASVAGKGPTNTELEAAANWDRVYARKACRLAFVKTNG
jgi:hypothetical protein